MRGIFGRESSFSDMRPKVVERTILALQGVSVERQKADKVGRDPRLGG